MKLAMRILDWFMSPAANLHYREDVNEALDFADLCLFMLFVLVILGVLL